MTGIAPTVEPSRSNSVGVDAVSVGLFAALCLAAVLLQISIISELRVANAIPDLIAGVSVVAGSRHGALAGAVAGFSGGLLVELATPSGTLGVLALAGVLGGSWAGILAERAPRPSLLVLLLRTVAVALGTQLLLAAVWVLLSHTLNVTDFVVSVLIPGAALTALVSLPALAMIRRRMWPAAPAVDATPLVEVTP